MRWGRTYFAVQAAAGAVWWIAVFTVPFVREATLGSLDALWVAVFDIPLFVAASAVAACGSRVAAATAAAWTSLVAVGIALYATVTAEAGWGAVMMTAAAGASVLALCLVHFDRVPTAWLVRGPFRFRTAVLRAGSAGNVLATAGQIIVFWGLCLVVIPVIIAALEQRWQVATPFVPVVPLFGAVLLLGASALGLWAAYVMSTLGKGTPLPAAMPNRLVIAGPYLWVRNPMAISGIVQGVAVGLMLSSWLVVAYAIAGSLVWNYAIRPFEEADLEQRFGDEFRRYRDTVPCWIPRRVRYSRTPALEAR